VAEVETMAIHTDHTRRRSQEGRAEDKAEAVEEAAEASRTTDKEKG